MPVRLSATLLAPVLVALVLGGFQVKSSIDAWGQARRVQDTARLVQASLIYANALSNERDISAAPLLEGKGPNDSTVVQARKATSQAADAFDQAARNMPRTSGLERHLSVFRTAESRLPALRQAAYTAALTGVQTEAGYAQVQRPLMEFADELDPGTGDIGSYGRTAYAISLTQAALSLERSIGMHLLIKPGASDADLTEQRVALSSYAYLEGIAVEQYHSGGTQADADKLADLQKKAQADGAATAQQARAKDASYVPPPSDPAKMVAALAALPSTDAGARAALAQQGVTAQNWWAVSTLRFNAYRQIESDLADKAVADASSAADDARQSAFVTGAGVAAALLAAVLIAGLLARRVSRALRQLRNAAFWIAEHRLPLLVDQLSRTAPGRFDTRVTPIPVSSTGEIGEVARAFDQVHREAARLATEQALLRGNINAIFANLSRRSQALLEGQLTLISELEKNEADPDQLEHLFRLDHLATRMRRNGENLLVLAGEEPGRRWDQPVPLIDVLRAASSEVEQYERIEQSGVPEAEIHGRAVTDLVHLLAELLENATTFSSPQTKVRVTAGRLPDGQIMIEIHDQGIGLTAEDFADINHKLADPPAVDAAISQRLGLFVVGRLSARHGIRVQLRPSGEQAGTTSLVMLPAAITHGGGEQPLERADFTVSHRVLEQRPVPGESLDGPPLRTPAELGFDDGLGAEAPDGARTSDPVGRSLRREERPAALEPLLLGEGGPQEAQESGRTTPPYQDGLQTRAPAYGPGRHRYAGGPSPYGTEQHAYEEQRPAYDQRTAYPQPQQPAYQPPFFSQGGDLPQDSGFPSGGGRPQPAYAQRLPQERAADRPAPARTRSAFEESPDQDDRPWQDDFQSGYRCEYAPEPESAQAADAAERDRVGFDRPGPAPSAVHELTDAGLPRRGSATGGGAGRPQPVTPDQQAAAETGGDRRSANDERWQQAAQLRKPREGGVTASGLPRRVPKANLIEGAATATPQGGPQVSRAPEDVRGRLSNLRRGVQRGRSAGSEQNGQATTHQHSGPDSTYHQER